MEKNLVKAQAVEMHYTVAQAQLLLGFECSKTIIRKIKDREFGDKVVDLGDKQPDYRIPASGLNAYLDRRLLFKSEQPALGIAARSVGELRRKAQMQQS
jgi:hypothetical protein